MTTIEKYALTVLEAQGKLAGLQKQERALCLSASCIWDMIQAKSVAANKRAS